MADNKVRKKPIGKTIFFGAIALAMYVALLLNQDIVNKYWALGGLYAFLPIGTAFVFSFIHGSFTGNFWTSIGVEASKKKKEVK